MTSSHSSMTDQLSQAKILCVGDIMLDRFVSGTVDQISPEAPVPRLKITAETETLGGIGNVAANLAALDVKTAVISLIGADSAGQKISERLKKHNSPMDHLISADTRISTVQTRFISADQQLLRSDFEDSTALGEQTAAEIIAAVTDRIENYDALILSDSGKGVLSDDICAALISLAKQAEIPVIIDPDGKKYSKYAGATVIIPDLQSLSAASDITARDDASIAAAAVNIITGCDIKTVLALRGREGLSVISENEDPIHMPRPTPQEIYDNAGVSDTIIALMAATLGSGATIEQATHIANIGGGIIANHRRAAVIDPKDLKSGPGPAN